MNQRAGSYRKLGQFHEFRRGRFRVTVTAGWSFSPQLILGAAPSLRQWYWGWVATIQIPPISLYCHIEMEPLRQGEKTA